MDNPERDLTAALRRVVSIVLEGVALNAFPYNQNAFSTFQDSIDRLRRGFDGATSDDAALMLAGQTIRCLEEYGNAAERFTTAQTEQMKKSFDLLTEALVKVSHSSVESVGNLRTIRTELENVSRMDDISAINRKLQICLVGICQEVERQSQIKSDVHTDLEKVAQIENVAGEIDAVTGLAGMQSARQAIRSALQSGVISHVYVFGVERMEAINIRFGFGVGDQILLLFAQQLAQRLPPGDVLFRWRGPCFVAVSQRDGPESTLASDAAKIAGSRLEHTVTVGQREIVLPIVGSWTMLKMSPQSRLEDVLHRVDEFAIHRVHTRTDGAAA